MTERRCRMCNSRHDARTVAGVIGPLCQSCREWHLGHGQGAAHTNAHIQRMDVIYEDHPTESQQLTLWGG